ncbi:biotin--[acetyl-CoA-carboxylase] ligase [Sulfurovum sp. zt1-1]|uniref:Biotin--[acetyl-CoA-carboxylase] ligase n=1 Tax=Sulfurovum zhangzhouensis TaxID=3019067 RepID=A0ABT7QXN3_9BACT|nr:biotin--[acetyl-CoA-carboxylase] ligase [Sulfurovum zhangzhouensis]MDM5271101.1 biotin--[acetyl-CoA-carboxylase] ligase [Sulfurovum zhangzhouensis]
MEIISFDILPSTQKYIIDELKSGRLNPPCAVIAYEQSAGIGSRDNAWSGGKGNFFASIAISLDQLPSDLPLSSASIYFSYIMKQVLLEYNEKIWLKWPNDFYLNDEKVGGTITKKIDKILVCGIGINLKNEQNAYKALGIDIHPEILLEKYLFALKKFPKWKDIFSEYQVEFELSRRFSVHVENLKKSLSDAILEEDGSLLINGKKVYSLR